MKPRSGLSIHSNTYYFVLLLLIFVVACKKKDAVAPPPPPVTIADSSFQILAADKMDINDFDVFFQIKPPAGESFSEVKLQWSTSSDFIQADSIMISDLITGAINDKYSLKRLKQAANYFTRISLIYKSKKFFSAFKEFKTDTLKLFNFPSSLSREVWASVKSSFKTSSATLDSSTKIYLDNILCEIPFTNGEISLFVPPLTLAAKKYVLRFERNGISVQAPDSVEVLRGKWATINPPVFPLAPGYPDNGLGYYGSCYSSQKGYIIPGYYFRQMPYGDPDAGKPGYVLEFDGTTKQWTRRIATNPMYFENPICHYANNSIFVIGGWTTDMYGGNIQRIQKMLKFDLNFLTWATLDSFPYPSIFNLVSFSFNKEFYIGMGADISNTSPCCGMPLPSNKFWKYNPAANTWTQLPDFPGNHEFNQNYPTSFVIGSKAYVFYGAIPIGNPVNTTNFRQELWEFDLLNKIWTRLSLPMADAPPQGEKYQIFSYNGKAYFLTAQKREFYGYYYGYGIQTACMEFDPQNMTFKKISSANNLDIMKLVFQEGNKFYFQADAFGYIENIPNRTHLFEVE